MKPYIKSLVFLLAIVAALTGCQATEKISTPRQQGEQLKSKLVLGITENPGQSRSWTKISEFSADLDTDGGEEKLELLTTAERDKKGNIAWDDGQNWLLLIRDGEKFYPLFSEYVQLGSVYFTVAQYGKDDPPKITVMVSTGANLKLANYAYSKDQKGYKEEPVYNSQAINLLFTSLPDYK